MKHPDITAIQHAQNLNLMQQSVQGEHLEELDRVVEDVLKAHLNKVKEYQFDGKKD